MTIWKYPLAVTDVQSLSWPEFSRPLFVGNQGGTLTLWAMVNPGMEQESVTVSIVGTGHPVDDSDGAYVGSAIVDPYVWHVFVRGAERRL